MSLEFEVETLDGIDDGIKSLYEERNGKFRLKVKGIDPADELKEALRKEREERAAAKKLLKEFEEGRAREEQERMVKAGEFQALHQKALEANKALEKQLFDLTDRVAKKECEEVASNVAGGLTRDTARAKLLKKEALQFIQHTPEGVKINAPDGSAMTAEQLAAHLSKSYPFLVDGSQASGSGAPGGSGSGASRTATRQQFDSMTQAERLKFAKGGGKITD